MAPIAICPRRTPMTVRESPSHVNVMVTNTDKSSAEAVFGVLSTVFPRPPPRTPSSRAAPARRRRQRPPRGP
ncbi:hypothetical protein NKH77_07830 [Streptomyces sp. M19]